MTLADENTTWNTALLELATQTTLQQTAHYVMAREICRCQSTRAAWLFNLRDGILITMRQTGQHRQDYFSKDNFKFSVAFRPPALCSASLYFVSKTTTKQYISLFLCVCVCAHHHHGMYL